MFEKLAAAIDRYLAGEITLVALRQVDSQLAADILLARPAERDQAAFDLEGRLFAGLVLLDNGDIDSDEFNAELRDDLEKIRASMAA